MANLADLNAAASDWLALKQKADSELRASGLMVTPEYTADDALRDFLVKELPFRKIPNSAEAGNAFRDWRKEYLEDRVETTPSEISTWLYEVLEGTVFG